MNLQHIAQGGDFDIVQAIKLLASEVAILQTLTASEQNAGVELAQLLNSRLAAVLIQAGYGSVAAVKAASDSELLAVPGVGEKALASIRERIQ